MLQNKKTPFYRQEISAAYSQSNCAVSKTRQHRPICYSESDMSGRSSVWAVTRLEASGQPRFYTTAAPDPLTLRHAL
jgi:hypothetical protein